jgi:hypothetical protein
MSYSGKTAAKKHGAFAPYKEFTMANTETYNHLSQMQIQSYWENGFFMPYPGNLSSAMPRLARPVGDD